MDNFKNLSMGDLEAVTGGDNIDEMTPAEKRRYQQLIDKWANAVKENRPRSEIDQYWNEIMEHLNEVTRRQEAEK